MYVSAYTTGRCDDAQNREEPGSINFWVHISLILLSLSLFGILGGETVLNVRQALLCRRMVESDPSLFDRLPFMVQRSIRSSGVALTSLSLRFYSRFVRWWDVFLCLSSVLVTVSGVAHILGDGFVPSDGDRLLSGLCCALMWFCTGKYFRLSRHLYTLYLLVSLSAPEVFRILVGASPLFLAYGLMGTTAFGATSTRFSSLTSSLTTLFSLMNGDIVLETVEVLRLNFPVLGPLYLASFFFLFTYFFLNVVLVTVEEALWVLNAEAASYVTGEGFSSAMSSR